MKRRVVVTGLGIMTSIGLNIKEFWENCLKAQTNVKPIPSQWMNYSNFNSKIWSPLPDINFVNNGITHIEEKQLDYTSLMAINSSFQALDHAGIGYKKADDKKNTFTLNLKKSTKAGVFIGTGIGGISTLGQCLSNQILANQKNSLQNAINKFKNLNAELTDQLNSINGRMLLPKRFNPFAVSMIMPNAVSANLGIKFNLSGNNNTYCCACASGTYAIGSGYKSIKSGETDFAIAGASENLYDEYGALFYAFDLIKALVNNYTDAQKANRPFDKAHSGFLYAQGGCGILIIEELEYALKRNAPIISEIIGFAETFDAHNIMIMENSGVNITKMLANLLEQSKLKPSQIDYINSHGTGTKINDEIESKIIEELFGKKTLLNSTKSLLGHTLGASGAIEAIVACLSIYNKTTHINKNLENPIRDLNFAVKAEQHDIKNAISQSFGFGGHNAALAFREYR